ncbi:MAG TPA: IS200/IS605 family transposase [Terriglobales bacterium]|nr:IS200/IS605 family transposase [Terriglobales bacterium]
MSHTYSNLLVHVIFSTQERRPYITSEIQPNLFAYVGGIVRGLRGKALAVGGTTDHLHLLMRLPQDTSVADVVRTVKTNSSRWIHQKWPKRARFSWQTGYASFSVSESSVSAVTRYILEQRKHHQRRSFQEEFLAFLTKNGISYDCRYVWG